MEAVFQANATKLKLPSFTKSNPPFSTYGPGPRPRPRPMRVTIMSTTKTYWACINDEIEAHLKEAIPIRHPVVVFEPMRHLALAGPKSTAPALCIAACELVGGARAQALSTASALQVMHAAVQAHDHLPLADRPRPITRPAIHHAFGPNIELLTGDGLLSFGYELLAQFNGPEYSGRVLRATIEVARAMGSQGMVEGQFKEVECGQEDCGEACEGGWLRYVYEKKDGGLHACGAACGAILGGGSEVEIEKLRKYGLYVGIIQGILHGIENKEEVLEMVKGLREMAFKELEGFNETKIEAISSFVDVCNI